MNTIIITGDIVKRIDGAGARHQVLGVDRGGYVTLQPIKKDGTPDRRFERYTAPATMYEVAT